MAAARGLRQRRKMQTVTMSEVARLAQVSPSTVSLYLRKPAEVSGPMAEKIQRAIDQLGYVPNFIAGGLASAGSRVVSIVVPSLRNAFFSAIVSRMEARLAESGIQTLVGNNEYSLLIEERLVRASLAWSPAAIVLTGLDHSAATVSLLSKRSVPVIEMLETGRTPIQRAVGLSHRDAGREVARYILSKGRRKPAFVGARLDHDLRAAQRAAGYGDEMRARDLEPLILDASGLASTKVGSEGLQKVLAAHPDVDGLVCSNDVVALGATFEANRQNIPVPDRIAIIGFGNLEFSQTCNPPLTTVELNFDKIADTIAEIVIGNANANPAQSQDGSVVDTGFRIVERESV